MKVSPKANADKVSYPNVTRVTVVGPDGIEYERYNLFEDGCTVLIQDFGRTIKILPKF